MFENEINELEKEKASYERIFSEACDEIILKMKMGELSSPQTLPDNACQAYKKSWECQQKIDNLKFGDIDAQMAQKEIMDNEKQEKEIQKKLSNLTIIEQKGVYIPDVRKEYSVILEYIHLRNDILRKILTFK